MDLFDSGTDQCGAAVNTEMNLQLHKRREMSLLFERLPDFKVGPCFIELAFNGIFISRLAHVIYYIL
jgi:hypothetical protein